MLCNVVQSCSTVGLGIVLAAPVGLEAAPETMGNREQFVIRGLICHARAHNPVRSILVFTEYRSICCLKGALPCMVCENYR